VFSTFSSTRRN